MIECQDAALKIFKERMVELYAKNISNFIEAETNEVIRYFSKPNEDVEDGVKRQGT